MKREKWDKIVEWLVAFGVDKWMHIVIIMVLAWVASLVLLPFGLHRAVRGLFGIMAGIVFSILKEVYDEKTTGIFDNRDLAADAIGLALFYAMYTL